MARLTVFASWTLLALLSGCDQATDNGETEASVDPVVEFNKAAPSETFMIIDEAKYKTFDGKTPVSRFTFSDFSYDVVKSESLVSPYDGQLTFKMLKETAFGTNPDQIRRLFQTGDVSISRHLGRAKYSWNGQSWALESIERRQQDPKYPEWYPMSGEATQTALSKIEDAFTGGSQQ